jgi:hypothetical protein
MSSPPRSPCAQEATLGWHSNDPVQSAAWDGLRGDLVRLADHVAGGALDGARPWDALIRWSAEALSLEGQEICAALILEPHGDLVDDLAETMGADELTASASTGACRCRS